MVGHCDILLHVCHLPPGPGQGEKFYTFFTSSNMYIAPGHWHTITSSENAVVIVVDLQLIYSIQDHAQIELNAIKAKTHWFPTPT